MTWRMSIEYLAKNTIETIDVRRVDAKAVVDHRDMMDAFGLELVGRQHHVCGVHRMDEVSDDAVNLLPRVVRSDVVTRAVFGSRAA